MPNYYAHLRFGAKLADRLPPPLAEAVQRARGSYTLGLYGPDPLLFSPWGYHLSQKLHAQSHGAETEALLRRMLDSPEEGDRAFAVGWLCHRELDDCCHRYILPLCRGKNGLSHQLLERGLDWEMAKEVGARMVPPFTRGEPGDLPPMARQLLRPARLWQYQSGLLGMAAACAFLEKTRRRWLDKLIMPYPTHIRALRALWQDCLRPTADVLTRFAAAEAAIGS